VWLAVEAGWLTLTPILAPRAVVAVETTARCAPEVLGEALFVLPPGTIVRLGPARDGFVQIDAGNDRLGWVDRDNLVPNMLLKSRRPPCPPLPKGDSLLSVGQ